MAAVNGLAAAAGAAGALEAAGLVAGDGADVEAPLEHAATAAVVTIAKPKAILLFIILVWMRVIQLSDDSRSSANTGSCSPNANDASLTAATTNIPVSDAVERATPAYARIT